ncbi:MAG: outer membrane protein assembly factor BamE [Verrucomicrobia bacterium]|nr:outer membrane protein assembly factor BamE [Verrucomicrobiota bacterium]
MIRALILTLLLMAVSPGCTVISSNSSTSHSGTQVPEETIAQLEVGKTTKEWVIATLGAPTSASSVNEKTEVLRYTSTRTRKTHSGLLLVLSANNQTVTKETLYLEFQEAVLKRYWKST